MDRAKGSLIAIFLGGAIFFSACLQRDSSTDYFSQVADVCSASLFRPTSQNRLLDFRGEFTRPIFPEGCRERLEDVLSGHFTDPSWETGSHEDLGGPLPARIAKEWVLEAFYRMVSEPYAVSWEDGRLFSTVWPESPAGSMPLDIRCLVEGKERVSGCLSDEVACSLPVDHPQYLNCRLFNYVLSRLNRFRYDPLSTSPHSAYNFWEPHHGPHLSAHSAVFYTSYFRFEGTPTRISGVLRRINTLIHEARHSDGYQHVSCQRADLDQCDESILGPYGFAAVVMGGYLEGQRRLREALTEAQISDAPFGFNVVDLWEMTGFLCSMFEQRINSLSSEVEGWLTSPASCSTSSPQQHYERWGLELTIPEFYELLHFFRS